MALEKDIIKKSGVKSAYHKISNVEINYVLNQCAIHIKNYKDDSFREKEKDLDNLKANVDKLYSDFEKADSPEIKNALLDKINSIDYKGLEDKNYFIDEDIILLDYIPEDLSYKGIYSLISSFDLYEMSKNV